MAKVMMDGNTAAAYSSYAFTEVAGIYPITPSSNMAEETDKWAAEGKKNIFGQTVKVIEMQSEAGAAGTMHGSLAAGALTTSYTASQGLLLMIPNMYKMAGELLPGVLHVSARAIAAHALSIYGDHSDIYACRQTGFAMLASSNVQEVLDLGAVAHMSAIKSRVPFLHFFDGFRTSHELQKIESIDYEDLNKIVDHDAIRAFRARALNPDHPVLRGTAQNPDIFFQAKEAANKFYNEVPSIVEFYMDEIFKVTGRRYNLFDYYGAPDADRVIISMGSSCDCIEEVVDYLNAKGESVGVVKVHLYRPFAADKLLAAIPKSAEYIAVLDRTKEPGALGDPLYMDVCTAFYESGMNPVIVNGRYGLGSKDVAPAQMIAVFKNLNSLAPKNHFTIGIKDDVTHSSLPLEKDVDVTPEGTISCKFWGLGGDGTVGANHNSIKIIGDNTDMYAQAYFAYDSKKSLGVTQSHLRFGKLPIRSSYYVKTADFVACHNQSYLNKYDMLSELKDNGTFLLNCIWSEAELDTKLPVAVKRYIANHNINFYILNGVEIAASLGLGNRVNTTLQAAFFKLANIIPIDEAVTHMKDAVVKSFARRGEKVVSMNNAAIDMGVEKVVKVNVPESWKTATDGAPMVSGEFDWDYISGFVHPINMLQGDFLPVSAFNGREDGTFEQGSAAYEKRGIAVNVPCWITDNCIQCNQCSYVCPHAAIRPYLLNEEETKAAPEGFAVKQAIGKGFEPFKYRMQLSVLDCTGCGNCADICPSKVKSLEMKPIGTQMGETVNWNYAQSLSIKENPSNPETVKGSQFVKPLLEFSGACVGCGETPYAKLITQLFGDRMYIGNATGCSSIWGGSAPITPFTKNNEGRGPAWANSLFEDTAEFSYGMLAAVNKRREKMAEVMSTLVQVDFPPEWGFKEACAEWLEGMNDTNKSKAAAEKVRAAMKNVKASGCCNCGCECDPLYKHIIENDDILVKKSVWAWGGDGWAYDIGFGGLDHVLASNENINMLVFDTEVYSNTGGQASKSTPTGAIAKFAASGMRVKKKDLGMIAMSYGYVYVAQIAMGANQNQCIKAITEAEAYPGPSIVIAYAPCIAHGINMGLTQLKSKQAVEAGYWHLYRYNPLLEAEGKNPFILDSKDPTGDFNEFINSETRYSSLKRAYPELAETLFKAAADDAAWRLKTYKKLAE